MIVLQGKLSFVVDTAMTEVTNIQGIICLESVCIYDTGRFDFLCNDVYQSFCLCIGNYGGVNPASAFWQAKYGYLACCASTAFAFSESTEVAFVSLYFT